MELRSKNGTIIKSSTQSHFVGRNKNTNKVVCSPKKMKMAYEYTCQYNDTNGINILTATRSSHPKAFERIDIDSLFLRKP